MTVTYILVTMLIYCNIVKQIYNTVQIIDELMDGYQLFFDDYIYIIINTLKMIYSIYILLLYSCRCSKILNRINNCLKKFTGNGLIITDKDYSV